MGAFWALPAFVGVVAAFSSLAGASMKDLSAIRADRLVGDKAPWEWEASIPASNWPIPALFVGVFLTAGGAFFVGVLLPCSAAAAAPSSFVASAAPRLVGISVTALFEAALLGVARFLVEEEEALEALALLPLRERTGRDGDEG